MVGTDASEFSAKCDLGTAAGSGGIYIWVVIVIFKYVKMCFGKGEDAIFERVNLEKFGSHMETVLWQ